LRLHGKTLELGQRVSGKVRLGHRVVLEEEIRSAFEKIRPVRTAAGAHVGDRSKAVRTSEARAAMKVGSSFRDSIRSNSRPSSAVLSRASMSISQRISRWSETKPTGATS